jgi:hypothetical protein
MTFVVAMFAATMGLVWFGYVATREWRSGAESAARAARQRERWHSSTRGSSLDMKAPGSPPIVPFNTTVLDEDPPFSTCADGGPTFARFP